jgi:hypothetical protein
LLGSNGGLSGLVAAARVAEIGAGVVVEVVVNAVVEVGV